MEARNWQVDCQWAPYSTPVYCQNRQYLRDIEDTVWQRHMFKVDGIHGHRRFLTILM